MSADWPFKKNAVLLSTQVSLCCAKENVEFMQSILHSELHTFDNFLIYAQEEFHHLSCLQQLYVSSSEANIIVS